MVKHCTAWRGWGLVEVQHSVLLFGPMAVITQQKHIEKLSTSLATSHTKATDLEDSM